MLTVLFLGDVVGEPGRNAVIARLPELKEQHDVDFIVVNGENAAGGRGITGKITIDLLRAGVSAVTTGDHVWDQKDILSFIETEPRLLRPVNYPPGAPGSGSIVLETAKGKVCVINVQCRTCMQPILENPFRVMEETVAKMRAETPNIIVDVHGETTSEKIAMGRFLDGKVSAVIGTHTHVQTADEQIMNRFVSNMPASFPVAAGEVRLHGALVEVDEESGRALRITRVDEPGPVQASGEPEPKIDNERSPNPEQT